MPFAAAFMHADAVSITGKRWRLRECDEGVSAALAREHGLPEILARLLAVRGIGCDDAEAFLNPSLKTSLPDPSHLLDMDKAAARLAEAVIGGETVAVFGDYDVDGATSSALLTNYFRMLGRPLLLYIPDRIKEGYGPNAAAMLELKRQGARIAVTVDCGTLSFEPLEAAHAAGLEVIVIDHHQGEPRLPVAVAVVNPNRADETSPHRNLAAVGVTFLLAVAINRVLRARGFFAARPEPDLFSLLDLVALGTVCDVVPLTGANRALVAQGLKVMAGRGNIGLRTLLDVARVDERPGCYHAGFMLGPRVNAGGRVGRCDLGAKLLSCIEEAEALAYARELDRYNEERKSIESMVLEQAMEQAELQADSPMILAAGEGWHPGVIGIVAGRLKERYHRPAAVVALENGVGKASARSVPGFDFGAGVIAARELGLLVAGGGHAMAAGFTVEALKLQDLRAFLHNRITASGAALGGSATLSLDGCIALSGATPELAHLLEKAGPFGAGNPQPRLGVLSARVASVDTLNNGHIRLILIDKDGGKHRLPALAFRALGTPLGEALLGLRGRSVHAAGSLRAREWQGREQVTLFLDDVLVAE